jgi:hypothetical protein
MVSGLLFLIRQGVINQFYEREIGPGTEWANEISIALENSQIVLLLISSDFLASDYPYDVETKRAIARYEAGEVRVLPVILRPVDWSASPLAKMQVLPRDGQPVSRWADRDEAWLSVIQGIRQVVEQIQME